MRAFITVGMGYGDEGKGATVDYLCRKFNAGLVVRYSGGCQCGHNVVAPNGSLHPFAQFGAGTFSGAKTYLGPQVIIDPIAMMREARALSRYAGAGNPYRKLLVNEKCLVITEFHRLFNRHSQINLLHGTCGMGVGVARSYWLDYGSDAIVVKDLHSRGDLIDKLELMRQRMLDRVQDSIDGGGFIEAARKVSITDEAAGLYEAGKDLRMSVQLAFTPNMVIVFEGAQGVLLDEHWGVHPHTTWSDVTPRLARELCKEWNIKDVTTIGVMRTYLTRHGNGPLPGEKSFEPHLPDPGNPENEFQGKMRYALWHFRQFQIVCDAIRESGPLDGFAVNHLDQYPFDLLNFNLSPAVLHEVAPILIRGNGPRHTDRQDTIK